MHSSPAELQHTHQFNIDNSKAGRSIGMVIIINAVVMVVEIAAGTLFGSMALLADGWHMGTHILALGITLVAYKLAHRYIQDARFAFGTWKIEILGGYTSAILLGVVGISMCIASVERLLQPQPIHYDQALLVAIIGLVVNIAGAFILAHAPSKHHGHHNHPHHHKDAGHASHSIHSHQHDLNMRAAYIHIITDALTSVLAIAALIAAKYFSWNFFDPLAGIIGAGLILRWTAGLLTASGNILLDREDDSQFVNRIRYTIESDGITRISDLHVWQIARSKYACIIVLLTKKDGYTIADFKQRLKDNGLLVHITIELHYLS
jgi:cation diffusion facilitator family transporter